jgi:hypothetical protein
LGSEREELTCFEQDSALSRSERGHPISDTCFTIDQLVKAAHETEARMRRSGVPECDALRLLISNHFAHKMVESITQSIPTLDRSSSRLNVQGRGACIKCPKPVATSLKLGGYHLGKVNRVVVGEYIVIPFIGKRL